MTLGTGSSLPTLDRNHSAHVLKIHGRLFLIDCGEGAQLLLKKHGISIYKIDRIFISHLHGDHVFGLFGLLSTMWMLGRKEDLHIYSTDGIERLVDFYLKEFGEGSSFKIIPHAVDVDKPTPIYEDDIIRVEAFPLLHRVTTLGYLFREKCRKSSRSFAYCSDTAPLDILKEWVKDVDLLYHEATFSEDMFEFAKKTFHSTTKETANIAKQSGVSKLVIGHFSSRYSNLNKLLEEAKEVFPNTELAEMGKTFYL